MKQTQFCVIGFSGYAWLLFMSELKKLIKCEQAVLPCYGPVDHKEIKIAASFEKILR